MDGTLLQVALDCSDLERAAEFYGRVLGLPAMARFDPPGLAFFRLGTTRLLLERSESPRPGSSTLYLLVRDVREACESLRDKGVHFESEPHLIHTDGDGTFGPPGTEEWMAFFRDPDGHSLALVERRPRSSAA